MIPEEHEQIPGRSDADRCNGKIAVGASAAVEGSWTAVVAVGRRDTRRDEAYVRRHHQQAVHEPEGMARLVPPALCAKHVPDAGDGVDPEQPDNASADYGMRALLRIGVAGPVVERLTECELDPEEGQRREAWYLWILPRVSKA